MNFDDVIEVLDEQEDKVLSRGETKVKSEFTFDERMFNRMANFVINLNPDKLSDKHVQEIINIIEKLEVDDVEELQEIRKPKLAKRTPADKNQYSKKWYRANKNKIKRRKSKFLRSSEGRKRVRQKEKLAVIGKTATGRRKVRYHVRKKSREGENNNGNNSK